MPGIAYNLPHSSMEDRVRTVLLIRIDHVCLIDHSRLILSWPPVIPQRPPLTQDDGLRHFTVYAHHIHGATALHHQPTGVTRWHAALHLLQTSMMAVPLNSASLFKTSGTLRLCYVPNSAASSWLCVTLTLAASTIQMVLPCHAFVALCRSPPPSWKVCTKKKNDDG